MGKRINYIYPKYEKMCLESQALDEQINSLLSKIKSLPEGKLVCARNTGSYFKWYRSDGHKSVYLPKSERKLAEKLAIKKYLSLLIEDLQNEKCAIDFYLRHYVPNKAEKIVADYFL